MKMAAKPARTTTAAMGRILYAENDAKVLVEQAKLFERAGYSVEQVEGRKAAEQALSKGAYDAIVLGHTLSKDDRHHLPYMAKKASRQMGVLVLHASGKHHAVDLAIDSREGDKAVLNALESVVQEKALAAVS